MGVVKRHGIHIFMAALLCLLAAALLLAYTSEEFPMEVKEYEK